MRHVKKRFYTGISVCIVILIILLFLLGLELYRTIDKKSVEHPEIDDFPGAGKDLVITTDVIKCPIKKCGLNISSFANTYSNYTDETLKMLRRFDVVVVEPYEVPDEEYLRNLKKSGTIVLAYIDVGKAEDWRYYWKFLDKNALIKPDQDWDGEYFVDINNDSWQEAIVDYEIPYILSLGDSSNDSTTYHGYDGLVLDNIDIIDRYPEMKTGMYKLVRDISQSYPGLLIVPNRGFEILPLIYPFIDAFKFEELCHGHDQKLDRYMPTQTMKEQKLLFSILKKKPMPVFVLDHIQTHPPKTQAALNCYYDVQKLKQETGSNLIWNANSVDQDLYMWDFLKIK